MALTLEDYEMIRKIIQEELKPIKADLEIIKLDVAVLARLNQLDDIRREPRLRKLYEKDHQEEA